jgi:hypothetical protein
MLAATNKHEEGLFKLRVLSASECDVRADSGVAAALHEIRAVVTCIVHVFRGISVWSCAWVRLIGVRV